MDLIKPIIDYEVSNNKRWPCKSNRASMLGYYVPELQGCLRRGVYARTHWEQAELPSLELLLIFKEGREQERIFIRDMLNAGVPIIQQQDAVELKEQETTIHIDCAIVEDGKANPIEFKSMSPNIYAIINCLADFKKKPWTTAYLCQIQIYMLAKNVDKAYFVLKNKSNGQLKQIEVHLDYELAEFCLKAAEAINAHIKAGTLPERITDMEKCKDCPFKLICLPQISFGEPLRIADDPEFEKRLDKYFSMKEAATECDKEYEIIKERCKATANSGSGELNLMVGGYIITGKKDVKGALRLKIKRQGEGEE